MKVSIGRKVIAMMAVLGIVFFATTIVNIMTFSSIKSNNQMVNIYMENGGARSEASTAFQQMQLYANLIYFKQYEIDAMTTKLQDCISDMDEAMGNLGNLSEFTKDDEVVAAYGTWNTAIGAFSEYCSKILKTASDGDFESVGNMVTDLRTYIQPAQEAEDTYYTMLDEKQKNIQEKSTGKIAQANLISYVMSALFLIVLAGTIVVIIVTVARPAKKTGAMLQQIVDRIKNNEGDLTERIPVKTKDEIGQMTQGINAFIEQLQQVMKKLKSESESMMLSVETVSRDINESNESAGNVSAGWQREAAMSLRI